MELIRAAQTLRDYTVIDEAIRENLLPYLYNNGEGRYIPISELIHVRRSENNAVVTTSRVKPTVT